MEYGNNIGKETVRCEYKELTWNHGGLEIDNELAEKLVNTSEWCFNDMILESINKYIKIYIPKYTSAFLNEESMTDKGEFYIGISDNGIVQGIPFQGDLNFDMDANVLEFISDEPTSQRFMFGGRMSTLHTQVGGSFPTFGLKGGRFRLKTG